MKISDVNKKLSSLKEAYEKAIANACGPIRDSMVKAVAACPEVVAVTWKQYTPYFNDGEACVFRVVEPAVFTIAHLESGGFEDVSDAMSNWDEGVLLDTYTRTPDMKYGDKGFYDTEPNPNLSKHTYECMTELVEFIMDSDDLLEKAFGDHVQVVVTAEGVTTERYEHD